MFVLISIQPATMNMVSTFINFGFTFIFLMEVLFKVTAWGPAIYLKNNWNRFDLVIVLVSLVDTCLTIGALASLKTWSVAGNQGPDLR